MDENADRALIRARPGFTLPALSMLCDGLSFKGPHSDWHLVDTLST